jgi:O-antigen/teichoic acid export membrane protein
MTTTRGVLLKTIADLGARASAFLTFPVMAHFAGAGGYGAYAQLNTVVGFVVPFAALGLGSTMVRFFSSQPWSKPLMRQAMRVGGRLLLVATGVSLIVAFLAGPISDAVLNWPQGKELFQWGSLLIVFGAVEIWLLDLLRARNWIGQYTGFQLALTAATVLAVLTLLPAGYDIVDLVIATALAKGALLLINVVLVARRPVEPPHPDAEQPPRIARMIRFGIPLTIAGLGLWMVNLGDRLVVGHYLSAADLGRYGAAYALGSFLLILSGPLFLPVYPRFMRAVAAGDDDAMAADTRLFHRWLSITLIPAAVFLAVIIKPALLILGGSEFGIDAVVGVAIVAALFLDQWNGLSQYVLMCRDRPVLLQNLWLACGVANIALNLLITPHYGLRGAALVTLGTFVVFETSVFIAASRYIPLAREYRMRTSFLAALAAAVGGAIAIVILVSSDGLFVPTLIATFAFWAVYLSIMWTIGEIHRGDARNLLNAIGLKPRSAAQ